MSVSIEPAAASGPITLRVSGKVSSAEWLSAQREAAKQMPADRLSSFLVIAEDFQGWHPGEWDDLSFQLEHDDRIARMAIVADERWKDEALMFAGKGFRKFEISFFPLSQLDQARAWLASRH
jgi:hypothetical protein